MYRQTFELQLLASAPARNLNEDFSTSKVGQEAARANATKTPRDSGASVDIGAPLTGIRNSSQKGVLRGGSWCVVLSKPGVYASWQEAKTQVERFSGHRVRKFKLVVSTERYVAQVQGKKQTSKVRAWYVLKNSGRDGAYKSRATTGAYKTAGSTLVEKTQ